jgi:CRISPR type III-B/RAMP module-associated protein Cmr3
MKHAFTLEPRDLLFLRDARPMAASDAGLGANWPRPDQLWHALIAAFHRQWPGRQEWEGTEHNFRDKRKDIFKGHSKDKNEDSSMRFGALKTVGPFPCKEGALFLPAPLDLGMELVPCQGTDLPAPLTHAFLPRKQGKQKPREWLSTGDYDRYLANGDLPDLLDTPALYDIERNIGIAINPETGTTGDDEHKLYQAEYLRLRQGVVLAFDAECDLKPRGGKEIVDLFVRADCPGTLVIGGQQGVARLRTLDAGLRWPRAEIKTRRLRWTLLSPAVFNAGWRPDWITDEGRVMLPNAVRAPGMTRAEWKAVAAGAGGFGATLVAARIGKPLAFSGWDLKTGPKPTQLAVPAGSCYVFDCGTVEEARALAAALAPDRPRSTMYGEKGFGIGLCSSLPAPASSRPAS